MLTPEQVKTSIAKAIDFLNGAREPHALLFMSLMHQRFGISGFADAHERYDAVIPEHPDRAPVLRVFRRVFDADNPMNPDDWQHVTIPTDQLLVTGLYCDRLGLPEGFGATLGRAVSQGGYAATHALLTWTWIQENRCEIELPTGFPEAMYDAVAAIINEDPTAINDIRLEAGAFLCLARQAARVDPRFVQRVVGIQNPDGGWGEPAADAGTGKPDESSWHSTILALMLLMHIDFPAQPQH